MMIWAAISDLKSYTLSNRLCLSVALLYPAYLLSLYFSGTPLPWSQIGLTFAIAALIFAVCAGLFALNLMGGGDVKLIPAVSLWAGSLSNAAHPSTLIIHYLFITALLGGVIAALILAKNHIKASKYYNSSDNLNVPKSKRGVSAVPYGVGIASGGLYVAFHLASALNIQGT